MLAKAQLAIQGGGAKLPHLIAAALPFQELHAEVKLTRVSGTSAGSIVAALVCAGIDLNAAVNFINDHGDRHFSGITRKFPKGIQGPIAKLKLASIVTTGGTVLDSRALRAFVEELFEECLGRIPEKISDVENIAKRRLFIVTSDLSCGAGHVFGSTEGLVESLIHSSAYPFASRNFPDFHTTSYVDGGLCENLPAELLLKDEQEFGRVFAISPVAPKKIQSQSNILSYIETWIHARSATRCSSSVNSS